MVVTKTEYTPIDKALLGAVEPSAGFSNVWTEGDMYNALVHDSKWLDTCKAQIDGISDLYSKQDKVKTDDKTP